jgi:hypothetical protein
MMWEILGIPQQYLIPNLILSRWINRSVSKFTNGERTLIKSIVATLSIKKIPDSEIIKEIYQQTGKTITRKEIYTVRQRIKKESYQWFKTLREGQFEYIYEFKGKIEEILWLQMAHHSIIDKNQKNPQIQQTSLAELHKLDITLSNYFDVAPGIVNGLTIPASPEIKAPTTETSNIIV